MSVHFCRTNPCPICFASLTYQGPVYIPVVPTPDPGPCERDPGGRSAVVSPVALGGATDASPAAPITTPATGNAGDRQGAAVVQSEPASRANNLSGKDLPAPATASNGGAYASEGGPPAQAGRSPLPGSPPTAVALDRKPSSLAGLNDDFGAVCASQADPRPYRCPPCAEGRHHACLEWTLPITCDCAHRGHAVAISLRDLIAIELANAQAAHLGVERTADRVALVVSRWQADPVASWLAAS